jgi:predicted short-subunit dehydrogenase-like oxidoreductase (DUF2520 family)
MHPLQAFAEVDTAVKALPDTFFFLEGDDEAVEVLRTMVVAMNGRPVTIPSENKALYHAGAVVASNFIVTLMDYAVRMMFRAGVPRDVALAALLPLMSGTVKNLETVGLPDALTGPIARGDVGTVKRHLKALAQMPGDMLRLYRHLARKTVDIAIAKGSLSSGEAERILELLAGPEYPGGAPTIHG